MDRRQYYKTPLIEALELFKGDVYCYTGSECCGKSTFAALLAIFLKIQEGESVAVIDMNDKKDLGIAADGVEIDEIDLTPKNKSGILQQLIEHDSLVIDLPIQKDLPFGYPLGESYKSITDEAAFTENWYRQLLERVDWCLFSADTSNGAIWDAIEHLAAFKIGQARVFMKYFASFSRSSQAPLDLECVNKLEALNMIPLNAPLTAGDEYLDLIAAARAKPYYDNNEPLKWPAEYTTHYAAVHNLSELDPLDWASRYIDANEK